MIKILAPISFFILTLLAFGCGNSGSNSVATGNVHVNDTGLASIIFTEYDHDFGKVAEGEKIGYTFTFTNQGTGDLIIKSATTTCGCTVPKFDKKPVSPGSKGSLDVVFDTSGRSGKQTKTITVHSNATKPVVLLKITAEVTE